MDPKFQTSFIPKKPVLTSGASFAATRKPFSFVTFLGTLIFIVTLCAGLGVFGYSKYLEKNISELVTTLEAKKSALNLPLIQELVAIDNRFDSAKILVNRHVAFSNFLSILEKDTLKNVRFVSLKFILNDKGLVDVSLNGEATGYSAVAAQADNFSKNKSLRAAKFSNLDLTEEGNVKFSVSVNFDPKVLSYQAPVVPGEIEPVIEVATSTPTN